MSQYSYDLTPFAWTGERPPYESWQITEPTTRRLIFGYMTMRQAEGMVGAGRRLTLTADNGGDNCVVILFDTDEECRAMNDDPGFQRRIEHWNTNRPRWGTWQWYLADVALLRYIFKWAGWTATEEERALMDALDEYGKRAPARYVTAA